MKKPLGTLWLYGPIFDPYGSFYVPYGLLCDPCGTLSLGHSYGPLRVTCFNHWGHISPLGSFLLILGEWPYL